MYPLVCTCNFYTQQMDKQVNNMWSIHTMEYYLALKRKEVLTLATMWMNLKGIMLSE